MTQQTLTPTPWQRLKQALAEQRELFALLDEAKTVIELAGVDGQLTAGDLQRADELQAQLADLEKQIADLRWGAAMHDATAVQTPAQQADDLALARAAKADNALVRRAAGIPPVRTKHHRPSPSGIRAAVAQIRPDLYA